MTMEVFHGNTIVCRLVDLLILILLIGYKPSFRYYSRKCRLVHCLPQKFGFKPPTSLVREVWERDSRGTGHSMQSRERRRGSEAIGRAAPGEGARGPHGRGGATGG